MVAFAASNSVKLIAVAFNFLAVISSAFKVVIVAIVALAIVGISSFVVIKKNSDI